MFTRNEDIFLSENFDLISLKEIAIKINKNYKTTCDRAKRLGLSNYGRGKSRFSKNAKSKYNSNYDYFSIPTIENCYWAGFFAADGYIRESTDTNKIFACMLSSKDEDHLSIFLKTINSDNPITRSKSNNFDTSKFVIASCKLVNDLKANFSFIQRKSLILKPPKIYDTDLIDSFIIGFIDGDGSIGLYKNNLRINIIGGIEILKWIKTRCDKITNSNSNINGKREKLKSLNYNGVNARILFQYFYNINVPKLKRKWRDIYLNHCINYIHPHTKINKEDSKKIFILLKNGTNKADLAKKYNVHKGTIDRILREYLESGNKDKGEIDPEDIN
jgi:hypothetical protein